MPSRRDLIIAASVDATPARGREAMLVLTARETEAFVKAILNPPEPGPVLRKAARQFQASPRTRR